jgi:hypothetical protein
MSNRLVSLTACYLTNRATIAELRDRLTSVDALAKSVLGDRPEDPAAAALWDRLCAASGVWQIGARIEVEIKWQARLLQKIAATPARADDGIRGKLAVWRVLHDPDEADLLLDSIMEDCRQQRHPQRRRAAA